MEWIRTRNTPVLPCPYAPQVLRNPAAKYMSAQMQREKILQASSPVPAAPHSLEAPSGKGQAWCRPPWRCGEMDLKYLRLAGVQRLLKAKDILPVHIIQLDGQRVGLLRGGVLRHKAVQAADRRFQVPNYRVGGISAFQHTGHPPGTLQSGVSDMRRPHRKCESFFFSGSCRLERSTFT